MLIYAYVFFGMAFIFLAAASLSQHITTIRNRNFIVSIIVIVFDILLLVFSILLFFFNPVTEASIISMFIALSLMMAGFAEIGKSMNTPQNPEKPQE